MNSVGNQSATCLDFIREDGFLRAIAYDFQSPDDKIVIGAIREKFMENDDLVQAWCGLMHEAMIWALRDMGVTGEIGTVARRDQGGPRN